MSEESTPEISLAPQSTLSLAPQSTLGSSKPPAKGATSGTFARRTGGSGFGNNQRGGGGRKDDFRRGGGSGGSGGGRGAWSKQGGSKFNNGPESNNNDGDDDSQAPAEKKLDEVDEQKLAEVDFSRPHKLQNTWSFWFTSPSKSANARSNWSNSFEQIHDVTTVEGFWRVYNNLHAPTHLKDKCSYYLFKQGVVPAWEDKANEGGGRWRLEFPYNERGNNTLADQAWTYLQLALIGEQLGDSPCGCIINVRKQGKRKSIRLDLWVKKSNKDAQKREVGDQLVKIFSEFKSAFNRRGGSWSYSLHDKRDEVLRMNL